MKRRTFVVHAACAAAPALALAQTVLKFSHTDRPGGAFDDAGAASSQPMRRTRCTS